jgi:hypothetical protein
MRPDKRAEFLRAWQQAATGLAAISALLDELPDTMRPELLQLLHRLKSSQIRRYHQVEQLPSVSFRGVALVEDAIEQQRLLAREVANFIDQARDECVREQARRSTALVPVAAGRNRADPDFRNFRNEVSATLNQLQWAGSGAPGTVERLPANWRGAAMAMPVMPPPGATLHCSTCHQPVPAVYLAPPPRARTRLSARPARSTADREAEFDEDADDPRQRTARGSRRWGRTAESLASNVIKAVGGMGMVLAVAVIVSAVAFRATRPSGQIIAHEQHDVGETRTAAVAAARPTAGGQQKPFVDRLELVPVSVPTTTAQAPAPAPARTHHDGGAGRTAPVHPARSAEPELTAAADQIERANRDTERQRLAAKTVARAAVPQVTRASLPVPEKVAAAPAQRPPVNVMRAEAKPVAASEADDGDGLYVAVLSTHKEAGAARDEFAELQKKYAAILGSKQSEVQVMSGQTGSWHRLVATPASTKAAANQICNDLRSAGYGRCWVKPY